MPSTSFKRVAGVATVTAGLAIVGWHAVIPSQDDLTDQGRQHELQREYRELEGARERERRRLTRLHVDAQIAESQRSAEIRGTERELERLDARLVAVRAEEAAADDAASAVARSLLRRLP